MSAAWPPGPCGVHTWWIRIFALSRAIRLPCELTSSSAPLDIAIPTQIVCTSGLMNCIVS